MRENTISSDSVWGPMGCVLWCGALMEFQCVDSMFKQTARHFLRFGIFMTIGVAGNIAQSSYIKKGLGLNEYLTIEVWLVVLL